MKELQEWIENNMVVVWRHEDNCNKFVNAAKRMYDSGMKPVDIYEILCSLFNAAAHERV